MSNSNLALEQQKLQELEAPITEVYVWLACSHKSTRDSVLAGELPSISVTVMALSHDPEYESVWQQPR